MDFRKHYVKINDKQIYILIYYFLTSNLLLFSFQMRLKHVPDFGCRVGPRSGEIEVQAFSSVYIRKLFEERWLPYLTHGSIHKIF